MTKQYQALPQKSMIPRMPRLPDRFDLWMRKARACPDPARQLDYILGAMVALPAWHFLNLGTRARPHPATTEVDGARLLLVFSDADRVAELAEQMNLPAGAEPPIISIPAPAALAECLGDGFLKSEGLLVNPGEDAAVVPREQLAEFEREWRERGGAQRAGFWIPNLTSEEEDFWQENGL
jgi:hypothetical protein